MKILLNSSILIVMFMVVSATSSAITDTQSTLFCGMGMFQCRKESDCIRLKDVCDSKSDCADRTDEDVEFCRNFTCPSRRMKCDDGVTCIDSDFMCDGEPDCPDLSDESEVRCESFLCPRNKYQCRNNSTCIRYQNLCDGYPNCFHGDDEDQAICRNFPCHRNELRCPRSRHRCVPMEKLCDGNNDCADGADEDTLWCGLLETRHNVPTLIHILTRELHRKISHMETLKLPSKEINRTSISSDTTQLQKKKNDDEE